MAIPDETETFDINIIVWYDFIGIIYIPVPAKSENPLLRH